MGGLCGWLTCTSAGVVVAEKQTKTRFNGRGKLFTLGFLGKGEYCRPVYLEVQKYWSLEPLGRKKPDRNQNKVIVSLFLGAGVPTIGAS